MVGLESVVYSRKQFVNIGLEKTDQIQDGYIVYKKLGKVFLVKEYDAPDKKEKVYYVKPMRVDKHD